MATARHAIFWLLGFTLLFTHALGLSKVFSGESASQSEWEKIVRAGELEERLSTRPAAAIVSSMLRSLFPSHTVLDHKQRTRCLWSALQQSRSVQSDRVVPEDFSFAVL